MTQHQITINSSNFRQVKTLDRAMPALYMWWIIMKTLPMWMTTMIRGMIESGRIHFEKEVQRTKLSQRVAWCIVRQVV